MSDFDDALDDLILSCLTLIVEQVRSTLGGEPDPDDDTAAVLLMRAVHEVEADARRVVALELEL